ncbi:hypothetical protein KCP77_22945 [Salmonella enterica subsp. enterica]|nr:hypothetical protein KCP77_22945 [Salmonella enterica subsp. enterica]
MMGATLELARFRSFGGASLPPDGHWRYFVGVAFAINNSSGAGRKPRCY